MLTAIYAYVHRENKYIIGIDNDLPWKNLKDTEYNRLLWYDMNNFKNVTIGKHIVMGYNTWDSLNKKPLKDRGKHFIITKKSIPDDITNGIYYLTLEKFKMFYSEHQEEHFVVIGGAQILRELLPLCDECYRSAFIFPLGYVRQTGKHICLDDLTSSYHVYHKDIHKSYRFLHVQLYPYDESRRAELWIMYDKLKKKDHILNTF